MKAFKWKWNIRKELKVISALAVMCLLIGFSERKQESVVCKNIVIELENTQENHFMEEVDVLQLLGNARNNIIGTSIGRIDLRAMERMLKQDPHILDAELFGDLNGNLVASVTLRRPIARIVRESAPDAYIAEDGTIMPVSDKYTSRVVLLSGSYTRKMVEETNLNDIEWGSSLMTMIEFIREDDFWSSQVAQMDMNIDGRITIFPQVTGQKVEFGKPEDIEEKFTKLMIFYKEILPQRGWTKYERVNLEYAGQVVAE